MPATDDRITQWLDSGQFRWPALASLMSLTMLAFVCLTGLMLAALTTALFDGHTFTGGQKLQLAAGWSAACGGLLTAMWIRERRAAKRTAAKPAISSAVSRAAGRHGRRVWFHTVTAAVVWSLAAAATAAIMTAVTLLPLEISGMIDYNTFTNIELLLIGGGWICVWCAALAAFSRWDQTRTTRHVDAGPASVASAGHADRGHVSQL